MPDRYPTPDSTPPTPALTPDPFTAQSSVPTEINIATRKQHTELNRLIVKRLSLALPARPWVGRSDKSPALLAQGIAAFAQIYFEFESAWSAIEWSEKKDEDGKMVEWLANLRPQGVERTPRLRSDLRRLRSGTAPGVGCREPVANLRLSERPHILIAYGWVMYMAIFSGGRWIRQQLADAGPEFELAFLSFDGNEDGEDIKGVFKARLARAEGLLTPQERREVVEEAQRLFDHQVLDIMEASPLLGVPPEVRVIIYEYAFILPHTIILLVRQDGPHIDFDQKYDVRKALAATTATCKQMRQEATPAFFSGHTFHFCVSHLLDPHSPKSQVREFLARSRSMVLRGWVHQLGPLADHLRSVEFHLGKYVMQDMEPREMYHLFDRFGAIFRGTKTKVVLKQEIIWAVGIRRGRCTRRESDVAFELAIVPGDVEGNKRAVTKALEQQRAVITGKDAAEIEDAEMLYWRLDSVLDGLQEAMRLA
ncbi:hypothetical protein B0A55_03934 [Friedmanniomyces simplex]|uniref:Uncharacterized protein n=1 Tax=Friedmanniomyces simplex TaxID=329884 RepID=A0A4V5NJB3_9PEZI|nr:hypothetical protein B0A55_03934 [Friedmanniomyces simplex]